MSALLLLLAAMLALALASLVPLLGALRARHARIRRDAALELHRAQLAELDRDREDGRIDADSHRAATVEISRRLLAADALKDSETGGNAKPLLIAVAILVPVMGFALYLPGGTPNLPSEPHAAWIAHQARQQAEYAALIAALRTRLAPLDPGSPMASEGQAYLAETLAEQAGAITPEALALFKQSYTHAPANAPWRALDAQRLTEAGIAPSSSP